MFRATQVLAILLWAALPILHTQRSLENPFTAESGISAHKLSFVGFVGKDRREPHSRAGAVFVDPVAPACGSILAPRLSVGAEARDADSSRTTLQALAQRLQV